jgi:uracil-DNA glycosylase family 4
MTATDELKIIREEIKQCTACPLHRSRKLSVPGEGPAEVQVMCIGEGPGYHENEQGRPFVGQAGRFLEELLAEAGLTRDEVFITNVVKCRPPGNRDPEPAELEACSRYLDRQIAALKPRVIVTLGRFSMSKFVQGGRISQIHGLERTVNGQTVVTMYHPAAALHQPALKEVLLNDFAKLKRFLGNSEAAKPSNDEKVPEKRDEPEQLSLF